MIEKLCGQCKICSFMPEQEEKPVLKWVWGGLKSIDAIHHPVLLIDNCDDKRDIGMAMEVARDLLQSNDFDYTTTIRCDFMPGELDMEQIRKAEERCAVWTHQLLENRQLIVSTLAGLKQMQVDGEFRTPGSLWRNSRLGVILHIPPLLRIPPSTIHTYQAKIQRALRGEKVSA